MQRGFLAVLVCAVSLSLLAVACKSYHSEEGGGGGAKKTPPFGTKADLDRAAALWKAIRDYRSWEAYPGKAGFQIGKSPHGKYLKYYINAVASRDPVHPADGYLIVKENYMAERDDALGPVTVMQKIRGYDPEDGDWFWVKFAPDGSVMKNDKGMSLAGRVAKGMPKGCIACHGNAGGGDFLFVNDDAPEGATKAPFGGPLDLARASDLWREIRGYRSWRPYPGKAGFQEGRSPHGKFLKYFVNGAFVRDTAHPGNGAIIVKENYMDRSEKALGPVTVMKKIRGYDPEDGDWFWVKFAPDGSVMKNPKGMSLAGRVAKGMPKGCIACHGNAGGGDFLFVNDE